MTARALLLAMVLGLLGVGAGSPLGNAPGGLPGGVRASDPDSGQGIPGAVGMGNRTGGGAGTLGLTVGRVVDARGRPVAGARLLVVDGAGRWVAAVDTGASGTFELPQVRDATVVVVPPDGSGPVVVVIAARRPDARVAAPVRSA